MPMPPACPPCSCVWPGRVTPPPSAPKAASSPPTSTGVPGASPVRAAAAAPMPPAISRASWIGGSRSRGMHKRCRGRLIPPLAADVEAVEAVGLGQVAGRLAREPRDQEAGCGEEPARRVEDRRLVRPEPCELGRDVRGVERVGDEVDEPRSVRSGPECRRLGLGTPVEPGHRRHQRAERVVHGHQRPADTVDGDRGNVSGAARRLAASTSATVPHRASHHRSGSISARTASGRSRSYAAVASATGAPPASQSAVFVLEVPWSTVTMYTVVRVRSRRGPRRRSYGGVMVPSRSQRSSQRWPAFQRKTWPLINRQLRSMPAMAAMSASPRGSPAAARRFAW